MPAKDISKIMEFLAKAGKLKETYRFSENSFLKNKESAADHSWRLSLMVIIFSDTLKLDIDKERALKIAIAHDIIESVTGDIDYRLIYRNKLSKDEKKSSEKKAINELKAMLPESSGDELLSLWQEYEEGKTSEARFVKALDKIETLSYLTEKGIKAIDDKEMILKYADNHVEKFPPLIPVLNQVKERLIGIINSNPKD